MLFTQYQLLARFIEGKTSGRSQGMCINGDTLFGHSWCDYPILVRREFGYLLNIDRYSCLSKRQGMCRHHSFH
jgi:hypothetical protein